MYHAISYDVLLNALREKGINNRTIGILIGNPNCEFVKNNIINRISEYHHSSNEGIDFYFPGYGAYWDEVEYPDKLDVCEINHENWSFSSNKFTQFYRKLEECSKWEYSGETELIILNFKNGELDFSEVLVLWLDRMVKEGVIYSPSNFFQKIFRLVNSNASIESVSDKLAFQQIATSIINLLKDRIPGRVGKIYDESKYFYTRNLKL